MQHPDRELGRQKESGMLDSVAEESLIMEDSHSEDDAGMATEEKEETRLAMGDLNAAGANTSLPILDTPI